LAVRILVLGGTSFVGRAIVEDALRNGADVTLFSRGLTGTDLFPGVPRLIGDRETGDYAALRGASGPWDVVVDVSGYVARHVIQAMDALGGSVERYMFISSHAVYVREGVGPGSTEETPLRPAVWDTQSHEELDDDTYGPSKVACEEAVTARYGNRATIVRPGKVAGPHDPQNGLTYWVRRAGRGGRIALAGRPEQPIQLVDVRDLARLVTRLGADGRGGAFHATGETMTLDALIQTCADVAGTDVEVVPVPEDTYSGIFPLVREPELWPAQYRDSSKARAAGMPATPLPTTIADVAAWDRGRGEPPLGFGFTAEEEAAALAGL
jgi:2'-hydroxyisoflavone reductase